MTLAASATWPSPSRLVSARCPSTCAPTPSPARRPAMREAMARRRSATTSTARTRRSTRSRRGPPSCCGREAALFVPSGTMANQIAVGLWAGRGDEVYAHRDSHLLIDEAGGVAALWGAQTRGLAQPRPRARRRRAARRGADGRERHPPRRARASLCIENTHIGSGGRVWRAEALARVVASARTRSACACTWTARACRTRRSRAAARWPRRARAPTACVLLLEGPRRAGRLDPRRPRPRRSRAPRALRKLLGGGMRQAGVIAAAGPVRARPQHRAPGRRPRRARALAVALSECRAGHRRPRRGASRTSCSCASRGTRAPRRSSPS